MENEGSGGLKGLKICFIAGTLGIGGAERQLFMILSSLIRLGSDVSLICLTQGEFWEKPIKDIGVKYFSLGGKGSRTQRLIKIVFLLRKIKPHIVQSQHFYTNLYAALGAIPYNIKSIGVSRSDLKREIRINGIFGIPSVKFSDYFIVNSLLSMDCAHKLIKNTNKLLYLPNAVNVSKFAVNLNSVDKQYFTVLAIGRLINVKRFDLFVDLIALLKEKVGAVIKGVIIGTGPLEQTLKKQALSLGLTQKEIEFISSTSSPEDYMHNSDLFVLTSDFEGTPNVVLEAMACGLPVVTTKVGNLPYFIKDGENGFLFEGDPEELCKIVIKLMRDKENMLYVSKNARQTIEDNFSIEILEKKITDIYTKIINE